MVPKPTQYLSSRLRLLQILTILLCLLMFFTLLPRGGLVMSSHFTKGTGCHKLTPCLSIYMASPSSHPSTPHHMLCSNPLKLLFNNINMLENRIMDFQTATLTWKGSLCKCNHSAKRCCTSSPSPPLTKQCRILQISESSSFSSQEKTPS